MQGRRTANFFDRIDRSAFWVGTGVAFLVYFFSLGPSVGLEDSGELITAAAGLGVPHPPGYPLWTMLSWLFCRLFSWVTWQGYPNPAWAVAFASAAAGAAAVGVTALLITRSARDLLAAFGETDSEAIGRVGWLSGIGASLAFAFSPVMWSQAVIAEVYALGALFIALTLLLAYRWLRRPQPKPLILLGLVFGLGLTNYQVLLLAALPIALLVCFRRWPLAKTFLALLIPLGLTLHLLQLGALPSADLFSTPGAPVILRPGGIQPLQLPVTIAPAAFYLTVGALLLASLACIRWVKDLRWVILPGGLLLCSLIFSGIAFTEYTIPPDFAGTLQSFTPVWTLHLAALSVLWWFCLPFRRSRRFALAVTLVQVSGLVLVQQGLLLGLTHPTLWWFWWPIVWNLILLYLAQRFLLQGRTAALTLLAAEAGLSVYAYMPLVSDLLNPAMNWGYPRTWEGFKHAVSRGQYEAIAPASFVSLRYLKQLADYCADLRLQFTLPVIGLTLGGLNLFLWRARKHPPKGMGLWLLSTLLFFAVMSAVLVALANPAGDLQDGFIQKVKFISSHGIFALWIGYASALILIRVTRLTPCLRRGCTAALLLTLLLPFAGNFTNRNLIRQMGAAEQTGHDFGWQFGAWMLGGAPAITAELSPDEEPLPDPLWPEPMAEHAVFFGGTDAGRFVPTYMVFAADFRSDIAVLTQNALADPTYMNVIRDLYGADLWLPSADEVRGAFTDYVAAVQSGERAGSGRLIEENGRVQLSGSGAIMEINADLCRKIVTRNPERTFYLEESYPVEWMRRQLLPAGLAVQITRETAPVQETATSDRDFWDWMKRRLLSDPAYRRDFAAQKAFSKLRLTIGSVYTSHQLLREAEAALQDAVTLYPDSSEILFRYLQQSLVPRYRFDEALRFLRGYLAIDPKNARAVFSLERIESLHRAYGTYQRLTQKIRSGRIATAEVCELARICEDLSKKSQAEQYWEQVLSAPDLSARDARDGCVALQRLQRQDLAIRLLRRVPEAVWKTMTDTELIASSGLAQLHGEMELALKLIETAHACYPTSGRVWLGAALYSYGIGEEAHAFQCMRAAVKYGASSLIEEDPAVAEIFISLTQRYGSQKGDRP